MRIPARARRWQPVNRNQSRTSPSRLLSACVLDALHHAGQYRELIEHFLTQRWRQEHERHRDHVSAAPDMPRLLIVSNELVGFSASPKLQLLLARQVRELELLGHHASISIPRTATPRWPARYTDTPALVPTSNLLIAYQ